MSGVVVVLLLALQVQATGRCPTADDVEQRLAPLLPPGLESSLRDVAQLDEDAAGGLTLTLAQVDGGTITRRQLVPAASCGDRAETVAVALAIWESQIHPEIALQLDRLSTAP